MTLTAFSLTRGQRAALKALAERTLAPMAAHVRKALDEYIARHG